MVDAQQLSVVFYDSSAPSYTDRTVEACDYARDSFGCALGTGDFLFLGRYKPWNAVFVEMDTANSVSASLTLEYHNGTTWVELEMNTEGTRGLTRSGFLRWVLPVDGNGSSLWAESSVDSESRFWVRVSSSAVMSGSTSVQGLSIVFADDQDLKREDFGVMALLPEDENEVAATSHILTHEAARDAIMEDLNQSGKAKLDATTGRVKAFDPYDLLDVAQVKRAATMKALQLIYFNASDNPEDSYWQKSAWYAKSYTEAMRIFLLTLDSNDDGVADPSEQASGVSDGTFYRS